MVQSKELAPIFRTPNQKMPDDSSRDLESKSTYSKGGGKRPDTGKIYSLINRSFSRKEKYGYNVSKKNISFTRRTQ